MRDFAAITALKAFAGAVAAGRMGFCLRTAFVSLGALGPLLRVLVLGTLVWMLKDYGIVNPDSPSLLAWVTLIVIGIILASAFPGRYCARA